MIRSISLANWRSHESSLFEFSKGTNLIVGIMGSGKSSVTDALCFALFGNFPALQHRKLKLSELIRSRPAQENEAKVGLELEIGGESYSISRRITLDGESEAEIRKEGKLLEGPQPKRVNELVEKLLSVDYDLFTRAIYSEQNNIDYFLELPRGERKRQIDELLGIHRFESARSELVKVLNRLKEIRAEKAMFIKDSDRGKIEAELLRSRAEQGKLEGGIQLLSSKLSQLASSRLALEKELISMESRRSRHRALSEKRAGLLHTVESLGRQLSCKPSELEEKKLAEEAESLRGRLKNAKSEISSLESSIEKLQSSIASDRSRLREMGEKAERKARLSSELSALLPGKTVAQVEKELVPMVEGLNAGMEELGKLRAQVSDGLAANTELEKGEGKCPVCEAPLGEGRKGELLAHRNRHLEILGKKIKELEVSLARSNSEMRKAREIHSRGSALEAKLSEITVQDKSGLEQTIASGEGEKRKADSRLRELRGSSSPLEQSLRNAEGKLELVSLVRELSSAEKELFASEFDEKAYERSRESLADERVSESEARAKKEGLARESARIDETIGLLGEKLAQVAQHADSIERIDSSLQELSIFQNCIIDTQKELREELITAINSAMAGVWPAIYPYGDYQEMRLSADEKGYELEGRIGENWIPMEGIASGGERASACLALRIAFAMALAPNLNWLILDEPTHNLDEEAVRSLAKALYEKIPEIVEQTFVITHDENLKDAATGSLYAISRNKGENGPSKVEKL